MTLFPWTDWQSWVVTLAAIVGAWQLVRLVLPVRSIGSALPGRGGAAVCGSCDTACAAPPIKARQGTARSPLVVLNDRRQARDLRQ